MSTRIVARRWPSCWPALAISALLSLPYLIAAQNFFYTDDWVHLSSSAAIPPWEVWRYFSPRVIWFYRPLQALQFGWLYHAAGLRPLAYNLSLFIMHLGVCVLVYLLAGRLTSRPTALLTTTLFASQWLCANALLWRSNFSTLQWALVTLALCILFLRYLEGRRPALLVAVYGLFLLDFLAKETAVNAPLLLAALWWWHCGDGSGPLSVRARLREVARLLGPFAAITLLYIGFHDHVVRDIYQGYVGPYYCFAPPAQAVRQTLFSFNYTLFSFAHDPVLLPRLPWLQAAIQYGVLHGLILPLALGALAWWRRDRLLILGTVWICSCLLPTAWLVAYRMDRFFYLPAVGAALITAHGAQRCWQSAANHDARRRWLRPVLSVGLAYLMFVNVSTITLLCLNSREDSHVLADAFRGLQQDAQRVPRGSLVVLRNYPALYFENGIGIMEMVRLGLNDPHAFGIAEGQALSPRWARRLRQIRSAYALDFSRRPFTLRPILPPERMARRPDPGLPRLGDGVESQAPEGAGAPATLCRQSRPSPPLTPRP